MTTRGVRPAADSGNWRRTLRQLGIAAVAATMGVVTWVAVPSDDLRFRLSMVTAYVGLGLLAWTLVLGPWYVLRGRRVPVHTPLRRDVGIWTALVAIAHVVIGLQVHLRGRPWEYFVYPCGQWSWRLVPMRYDLFGAANWTGLAAGLILVLLLVLSNDFALRRLGPARWKALQRWNYVAISLVAVHAAFYQVIERRALGLVLVAAGVFVLIGAVQFAGYRRRRGQPRQSPGRESLRRG